MPLPGKSIICNSTQNKDCYFCSSWTDGTHEALLQNKTTVKFRKGQVIFHQETRPLNAYSIYKGKVKIVREGFLGKDQILEVLKKGELLCLKDTLISEFYTASAVALEETYLCIISKDYFLDLRNTQPLFYDRLMQNLTRRINDLEDRTLYLAQKSVRQRLAIALLDLHEKFGVQSFTESYLDLTLSREDIANLIGTATESAIRLLSEFKKEGLITFSGKKIVLTNILLLRRIAEI
ncbi:MAG TPA: Crp/Fnr family transcriptional regulator [Cytophagaceae bacterium]|jgi:CRP/FNR family transcriptional regulator